jgi:hypothetical protein
VFSEFNYIPRGKTMRKQAKTYLSYIGERPGKDKADIVRTLFGKGRTYTREQVEKMIEDAPDNTLFWRLKLNPDPVLENPEKILNLEELTRDAVSWLERRLGKDGNPRNIPFIAAIHDDHTQLAHVHALLFIERNGREKPIDVSVINDFRDYVSLQAMLSAKARLTGREENYLGRLQEQSARGIAMQAGRVAEATPTQTREDMVSAGSGGGAEGGGGGEFEFGEGIGATTCPECFIGTIHKRLNSRVYECDVCGFALRKGVVIKNGRRKEAQRERAY